MAARDEGTALVDKFVVLRGGGRAADGPRSLPVVLSLYPADDNAGEPFRQDYTVFCDPGAAACLPCDWSFVLNDANMTRTYGICLAFGDGTPAGFVTYCILSQW